jgi:hypothetical protein
VGLHEPPGMAGPKLSGRARPACSRSRRAGRSRRSPRPMARRVRSLAATARNRGLLTARAGHPRGCPAHRLRTGTVVKTRAMRREADMRCLLV